jgi:acyl-CoA thioesterase FadM
VLFFGKKGIVAAAMLCKKSVTIRLQDTDCTGVLYFIHQLRMAQGAFEEFLDLSGLPLKKVLASRNYLLPLVHVEADYLFPVQVGDELEIQLSVVKVGTTSFSLQGSFYNSSLKREVGRVLLVHVVVSKEDRSAIPVPNELKDIICGDAEGGKGAPEA